MYEHRYKHGKQKTIMTLAEFQAAVNETIDRGASLEELAYMVLLWHTGVRKSEAYERLTSDIVIEAAAVVVDFHKRKKGGEEVPPLHIPLDFYGVKEFLIPWLREVSKRKPSKKNLYSQLETDVTRVTAKGKTVTVKQRASRTEKAKWLFPGIASTKAWSLVKDVLGENFYPHYLRLRKLSAIAKNPATKSIIHIKSVSGLKSLRAIEAYMGVDEQSADEAMRGSDGRIPVTEFMKVSWRRVFYEFVEVGHPLKFFCLIVT